jgi:hypothetical protein
MKTPYPCKVSRFPGPNCCGQKLGGCCPISSRNYDSSIYISTIVTGALGKGITITFACPVDVTGVAGTCGTCFILSGVVQMTLRSVIAPPLIPRN